MTKGNMQNLSAPNRNETDIIQSASVTALFRALMAEETGLRKNPDYLARYFVNDNWKEFLSTPEVSRKNLENRLPGGIYYHLIRTIYFDKSLIRWLKDYPKSQVVFLGTGFDSRSVRLADELENTRIYEVDLGAMLDYKKAVLEAHNLDKNSNNKKYVSIDFHTENTLNNLCKEGFDVKKPTFYLMEGLSFFLEEHTVVNIFKELVFDLKGKTRMAFDYVFKDYIEGDLSYYGAAEMNHELSLLEEPHLFGLNYEMVDSFFSDINLSTQNNYTSLMLEALYLTNNNGDSIGRPHAFFGLTEISN